MDTLSVESSRIRESRAWPLAFGAVGIYALWLGVWYADTIGSMVAIWYRSETFAHGFVVWPISGWLVWRQRRVLARIAPAPSGSLLPGLVMVVAAAVWFAGDLADVLAARHFAWITLLIAGIWLLVGDTVARRIAFPLCFLYFAVPFGEFLLPTLIEWTANFTVAALRASGVPVLREGMTFVIPNGSWSVVEACAGLRYLIASLTVGVLYAYLAYRSFNRRLAFVAAAVVVPIVANWFRAYMIVMIGYLSGNRLAVGVDHYVYGWVFFGIVIALLFWVGNFWREDSADATAPSDAKSTDAASVAVAPRRWGVVLLGALLLSALAPAAVRLLHDYDTHGVVAIGPTPLGDWRPANGVLIDWVPDFTPPRAAMASTYERGSDRAGLYIALYYDEDRESKLVSSVNRLMNTTNRFGYVVSEGRRAIEAGGEPFEVMETVLRIRGDNRRILARSWYWIDGAMTASPVRAKIRQAFARVRGHGDAGAIVVVYVLIPADGPAQSAALDDLTTQAVVNVPAVLAQRLRVGAAR